jgi:hypothetical protein
MTCLPSQYVVENEAIVWIASDGSTNVNHSEGKYHFINGDLIKESLALDEMCTRINMRSPLTDVSILVCEEPAADCSDSRRVIEQRNALRLGKALTVRGVL